MKTVSLTFYFALIISLFSCQSESGPEEDHLHDHSEAMASPRDIIAAQSLPLGRLGLEELDLSLVCAGRIEAPPQSQYQMQSPLEARISAIHVIKGQAVRRGEALISLSHPQISAVQQDYRAAKAQAEQAEAQWQRSEKLYREEALSQSDWEKARALWAEARSREQKLAASLRALALDPEAVAAGKMQEEAVLRAPFAARVADIPVRVGQIASAQSSLMQLISSAHLHLELDLAPQLVAQVKAGQKVRFSLAGDSQTYEGEVYQVDGLASASGFYGAHVHFADSLEAILEGRYARAEILVAQKKAPALPRAALYEQSPGHWVALALEDEQWLEIPVELGLQNPQWMEVLNPQDLESKELVLSKVRYLLGEAGEHDH